MRKIWRERRKQLDGNFERYALHKMNSKRYIERYIEFIAQSLCISDEKSLKLNFKGEGAAYRTRSAWRTIQKFRRI